jgi:deoxyribonuclease-4
MFGSHLSISGGLHNALIAAHGYGMVCVQIFTKNQRQWASPPLTPQQIADWTAHRKSTGIDMVVTHDTYLINLCAADRTLLEKSVAAFRDEIERCETLSIPYLVTHPGCHVGQGDEAGLAGVAAAINAVHKQLPGYKTITCLEITAGQGSSLGHKLEHLRTIIDAADEPERLAVCIDTSHALEAGYDLTSAAGTKLFLKEVDDVLGLDRVKVMHINDSKTPRGSRVDRHEHIGHGHVSLEAFEVIVNHPKLKKVPKILETPKEKAPDGRDWDVVNIETLKSLMKRKK